MTTGTFNVTLLFRRLEKMGWNRRKIAYVLGVGEGNISRIMRGYSPDVRVGTLLKWSNALHISISDLMLLGAEGQEGDNLQLPLIDEMYESGFQTQHEEGRFVAAVA